MSCIVFFAIDSQLTVVKRFVVSVINMISRVRCPVGVNETILFGSERSDFEPHPLRERNSKTHEMPKIYLKNPFFKNIIFTRIEAFRNFSILGKNFHFHEKSQSVIRPVLQTRWWAPKTARTRIFAQRVPR